VSSYAAQIGISYLAVVCVLLSYSLSGTGPWRHAHWTGKATLLLLAWMTLPHSPQPIEPRLSEQKQILMERIASHYAAQRLEREQNGDISTK